jgi:hypothetical protein
LGAGFCEDVLATGLAAVFAGVERGAGDFTDDVLSGAGSALDALDFPKKAAKPDLAFLGSLSVAMSSVLLFGGIAKTLVKFSEEN